MKTLLSAALILLASCTIQAQQATLRWWGTDTQDTTITVWKGERISIEGRLSIDSIPDEAMYLNGRAKKGITAQVGLLGAVITDDTKGCGLHPMDRPTHLAYDIVNCDSAWAGPAPDQTESRFMCTIEVPRDIKSGRHYIEVRLVGESTRRPYGNAGIYLNVIDRQLPEAHDYKFHTDFWQQPYSVSRYYGVERWSQEHFDLLRPYMRLLARAGQKVVSAILFYEPWGDQSYDKFTPMIETTLKSDSTWSYDYTVFDRWVKFMADCGIDQQIDCYSMVPWDMNFRYYDEAKGDYSYIKCTTQDSIYSKLWTDFLKNFALHLKENKLLDKTCIAMDERQMPDMLRAHQIAQAAVPGIKMTLAGNYHKELAHILQGYSIAYGQHFPPDTLALRRSRHQVSTVYTCCTEAYPNIFTNSVPIEGTYIPLYAISNGFDGYLHWSWMNWAEDPLHDSRYRLFSPGDTYVIYPDNHSSVRWERYIEGVQMAEKVRIMRELKSPNIKNIEEALDNFKDGDASDPDQITHKVELLKTELNKVETTK